jgi:hypothetical protein
VLTQSQRRNDPVRDFGGKNSNETLGNDMVDIL